MNFKNLTLRFSTALMLISFVACKPIQLTTNDYQQKLQEMLDSAWAVCIGGKSGFPYPGGYGLQVLKDGQEYYAATGELRTIGNQVHFRAGSTTKTFTGAAILMLHQEGKLNINDYITDTIPGSDSTYIPNTDAFNIPNQNQITIKLLLQHRAGIFDITNTNIPDTVNAPYHGKRYQDSILINNSSHTFTTEECVKVISEHQLSYFAPNEAFHYSNIGSRILSHIVERVTDKKFDEYVTNELLLPNDLNNTKFPWQETDQDIPAPVARGYIFYGDKPSDVVTSQNVSLGVGQGNVITTPQDLTNWIDKLLRGKAGIDQKYIEFLMKDCIPTFESHQYYGLQCTYTPGLGYGHNGGVVGYFTATRYNPEWNLSFTVFTNTWDWEDVNNDLMIPQLNLYDIGLRVGEIFNQ